MINTYRKGDNVSLGTHFKSREFDCPCKNTSCTTTSIDPDLITKLEAFRALLSAPLTINSGYRCQAYQDELRLRGYETALGISQHQLGRAVDVMSEASRLSGASLEPLARQAGFMAVGVGNSWVHVDLRTDKAKRWVYATR